MNYFRDEFSCCCDTIRYMLGQKNKRIYLDHASGTASSKTVLRKMQPFFSKKSFNPGGMYRESVMVAQEVQKSREDIARIIKSQASEIYFVDGATESNNIAIIGAVQAWQKSNPHEKAHVITTKIEHAAVLETCQYLESNNVEVTYLDVNDHGKILLRELKEALRPNTVLVSIGYVNGEIGTIQDIKGVMKTIRHFRKHNVSRYPYVHSDAVQAINYVDEIGVPQLGIDLLTFNASKIYGPKKIAILYAKKDTELAPLVYGGNQEKGLRSGTENVPYIVAMAQALKETRDLQQKEKDRLHHLQSYLEREILNYDNTIVINSCAEQKIPNIVNISIPKLSHEEVVIRLDASGFMCSVKSACKAGEDGDSHVIQSLRKDNTGSLRISLGRDTSEKDIKKFVQSFQNIVDDMKDTYEKYYH